MVFIDLILVFEKCYTSDHYIRLLYDRNASECMAPIYVGLCLTLSQVKLFCRLVVHRSNKQVGRIVGFLVFMDIFGTASAPLFSELRVQPNNFNIMSSHKVKK
jgi:hypothetical protein